MPGTGRDGGELADDESVVMPEVADGTAVRYVDVSAPWLGEVGGDERGERLEAAIVARIRLRYDETKADLVRTRAEKDALERRLDSLEELVRSLTPEGSLSPPGAAPGQ